MLLSLTHFELSSRTQSSEASCHTEVLSSHQEFTESFVSFRSLQSFGEEVCNVVTSTNVTDLQHHVFDVVSNSEPSDLEILAAAQSPDSCPPSRARRRRHARARCAPSRGIVWRTRAHAPFPLGVVDEPASLSLFVARRLVIRQKSFLRVCGRNPARSAPPSQPAQPTRDATPNTRTSTAARPLVGVSSRKARARRSSRSSCSIASSPPAR